MGDMTTISTCGKCGLHYRESLIPHRCADWTKGRKEVAKESHQMSEHQVNQSGNCVIEGCPCRGWSAQETASVKEINEHDPWKAVHRIKLKHEKVVEAAKLLLAMNNCNYDRDQMRRSGGFDALWEAVKAIEPNWTKESSGSHQPAARGGGDLVTTARDFVIHLGEARKTALCKAITHTADLFKSQEIINQLADEVIVQRNAVDNVIQQQMNQHQSLVAEREQMVEALKGVAIMLSTELEKYDKEPWAQRVRAALTTNDRKRGAR